MSYVTNVMLQWGTQDWGDRYDDTNETVEKLNETIAPVNNGQGFGYLSGGPVAVGDAWGGHKFPEIELAGAAFNFWNEEGVLAAISAYPWHDPDSVRLFICDQDDDVFSMYRLTGDPRTWELDRQEGVSGRQAC